VSSGVCDVSPDAARRLDSADAVYNGIRAMIDKYVEQHGIAAPVEPPYQPPWAPRECPTTLDLAVEGITSVVWSIGFRADLSMIRAPAFGERGALSHRRGVTAAPGLYILGLPWLHTWGSARMSAVGRDAEYVVDHLDRYLAQRAA
jgi:putative flavoprotein involved in K+ transport